MAEQTEKTAVPDASVGADAGQLSGRYPFTITDVAEDRNHTPEESDDFFRRIQRMQDPTLLNTISYNQLMEEALPGRKAVIDGILGTGAYILAGAPKIGKSFLVAQIAYQVSSCCLFWDYTVHPGTVLYLALEDDKKRLQERMSRMFGVDGSDRLHFATEAGQVGKNLDQQLENFMREHPDTVLIIVDTLQKVREMGGDTYSYASDYEVIGKLKQFADTYHVCVLIVHHTRKQPAGDTFEMISGTTGLLGCADGALLMKKERRTDSSATLELVSRDYPDQKLYLTRNQKTLVWDLDHAETEPWKLPPDPVLEALAKLVNRDHPNWEGSPTELVNLLHLDMLPNHLTKHLNVYGERLMNEHQIAYLTVRKHSGRKISFTFLSENGM